MAKEIRGAESRSISCGKSSEAHEARRAHGARSTLLLLVVGAYLLVSPAPAAAKWTRMGFELIDVLSVTIDPVKTFQVYTGFYELGGASTNDGGTSWRWLGMVPQRSEKQTIDSFAILPTSPRTVLAAFRAFGLFRSVDAGESWPEMPVLNKDVRSLAVNPANNKVIYAGARWSTGGVYKSLNSGRTWNAMLTGLTNTDVKAVAIAAPPNTETIYAGTGNGVFRSINGGNSWTKVNNGLGNLYVQCLAADPTNPKTLYAGTFNGVYKSTNRGATWIYPNQTLQNLTVDSIAINRTNPLNIFVGTNSGLYRSADGGTTWVKGSLSGSVYCLSVDPKRPKTIYAGTSDGFFKSTDGGL